MTRDEFLRRVAVIHRAYSHRHGDTVPYNPAHENPHDGVTTDLSLHQADRSAPPAVDDEYNRAVADLIEMRRL